MPSVASKTYPETTFRIIHRDTIGACIRILHLAEASVIKYRVHDFRFLLPEVDNALRLVDIGKYTSCWPAIVEVESRVDQYFQSVLEDAKLWWTRLARLSPEAKDMRIYLTPFPVFKSCHLRVGAYGLVRNRRLVALSNEEGYHGLGITESEEDCEPEDVSMAFHEMLHIAGWMCEDPERRLYTKRFALPPSKRAKARSGKGLIGNGKVSIRIRIDGESEAGMYSSILVVSTMYWLLMHHADSEAFSTPTTTRSTSPHLQ